LDDCLFLLDGRLSELRILFLTTFHILPLQSTIINKVNYFRIKCIISLLNDDIIIFFFRKNFII